MDKKDKQEEWMDMGKTKAAGEFDFEEWQEGLHVALVQALTELTEEYDEVYAVSLMASSDLWSFGVAANTKSYLLEQAGSEQSEDYCYYKYAEEEWGIMEAASEEFEDLADAVRNYLEEHSDDFTDEDYCFTEEYQAFRDELFGTCLRTLRDFVKNEGTQYPQICWNFYVREFFEAEDMAEIYRLLNQNETAVKEFCSTLDV